MRASVRSEVQTVAIAVVVSLLIWLWAEGQNVTRKPLSVQVILPELAGSDLLLDAREGSAAGFEGAVRLVFEGSTAALERVEDLRGSILSVAPGSPGLPTTPGANQVVNLMSALRAHPEIIRLNATLTLVEPETVVVSATRLASRELPVRVELARNISLAGDPRPSVGRVRVRVPEAQAGRLNEEAYALAVVSEDQILGLRGEGTENVKATLRLPAGMGEFDAVRFQPDTIDVTLRVRQALESAKLPANVPVWLALPPTERTDRWEIEVLDKFLPEVTVSGPPEQVARLGRPGTTVKAVVEIGSDDLQRMAEALSGAANTTGGNGAGGGGTPGVLTKAVVFTGLPAGVTPVGQAPQVRVRIVPVGTPTVQPAPSPNGPAGSEPGASTGASGAGVGVDGRSRAEGSREESGDSEGAEERPVSEVP